MRNHLFLHTNYVYRLIDHGGRVLYIGCSTNPMRRLYAHRSKPWGNEIAEVVITEHANRPAALAVERDEIYRLDPPYNDQGRPGFVHHARRKATA